MEITFGKFKGFDIEEVPCSYLRWMDEEMSDKEDSYQIFGLAAGDELRYRSRYGVEITNEDFAKDHGMRFSKKPKHSSGCIDINSVMRTL